MENQRLKGTLITLAGVMVFTPDALLIRLAGMETLTYSLCRGLLIGLSLAVALQLMHGRRALGLYRAIGRAGLWAALLNALGGILFIAAFAYTSVANVLLAIATQPILSALLSRLFLGERVAHATQLAIGGALVGIVVVVSDSLGKPSLMGDGCALLAALCFSGYFVILRRHREIDMIPSVAISGLLAAILVAVALPLTGIGLEGFRAITWEAFGWLLLAACVVAPLALALTSIGPRYIPAPEVTLLILLEVVLGPFWVWLALGEAPSDAALVGGAIILSSVAFHAGASLQRERWQRRRPPGQDPPAGGSQDAGGLSRPPPKR